MTTDSGFVRCPDCSKGQLLPSGVEPHRRICKDCGKHYLAVLQFIPVEPISRNPEVSVKDLPQLMNTIDAGSNSTSDRRNKIS